jgi:putative transposase
MGTEDLDPDLLTIFIERIFRFVYSCQMPTDDPLPERRYPSHQVWRRNDNRSVIVFVTVCTKDRRHLLADREVHELLVKAWATADSWLIGRYVLMPDHLHLFASPKNLDSPDLRKWVGYWKSLVKKQWPGEKRETLWQRDMWDRQLRTGDSYSSKWNYVRENPVRQGLVETSEDWPFQGALNELVWHD